MIGGFKMEKQIENLQKALNIWKEKNIIVNQEGFITSRYVIKNISYKIEYETLNIETQDKETYIRINLNQIFKIEQNAIEIKLYIDNDTNIILQIKQ